MEVAIRNRIVLLAAAGVVLAGVATAWLRHDAGAAPGPSPLADPVAWPASPAQLAPVQPAAPTDAPAPPGVTNAQWQALQAEMSSRPDGAAEIRRIADYLAWSDLVRRFREAAGGQDVDARRGLARAVDAGLAARLRAGEVTVAEARQIKSAILEVTLDAPAERAAALQRWMAAESGTSRPDPRQAEFEQRQSAIVASWAAQPARDRAALERELEALRRQVFGAPAAAR